MPANANKAASSSSSTSPAAPRSPPSVKKVFRGQTVFVSNGYVEQTPFVGTHYRAIANEGNRFGSAGASAIIIDSPVAAIVACIPPFAADPNNHMTSVMMTKMRRIMTDVHEQWTKMKEEHKFSLTPDQISVKFVTPRAAGTNNSNNTPRSSELAVMFGLGLANLDEALSPTVMTYDVAAFPAQLDSSLVVAQTDEEFNTLPRIYIGHIRFQ